MNCPEKHHLQINTQNNNSKENTAIHKNPKIQIIRAISITAVLLIHTCNIGVEQIYVRPFLNFAVATFLFLSGYLTNVSKINTKHFYKKRILRVLIPYIIWSILYTTISFIASGKIDLKNYVLNFLLGKGAAVMYYIPIYIQFVLLTPLLGKMLYKKKWWWVGLIISPISFIYVYLKLFNIIAPNEYISSIWRICCLGWFTFYYLGLYLGNRAKIQQLDINKLIVVYLLTIAIQITEGYGWYKLVGGSQAGTQLKLSALLTSVVSIMITYYYINSTKLKMRTNIKTSNKYNYDKIKIDKHSNARLRIYDKLLILIGNYSFGIYLSHCMVLTALQRLSFWKEIPFVVNSLILLTITLLCLVICKKICGDKISKYLGIY